MRRLFGSSSIFSSLSCQNPGMPRKLIFATLLLLVANLAFGHPEDEFCVPGQDGMDPALCAALAEMNSSEGSLSQDEYLPILDESGEERSFLSTAGLYIKIGIGHIIPETGFITGATVEFRQIICNMV